ncbi:50S ribosomal protein L3 [Candidatus Acetothermia bacterium]|nr:50S ribosomal protein L3 [Candidatus Acetothermia bacterium]MCI2427611.1 50S ribosomal protein L3 [Candidatus Acetothermia bacterium]MCI2428223.1 50S ribosomal protein L3 [Candidatus Acetothermia bacterium]
MRLALLGRKIGMTQLFEDDNKAVAVTVVEVEPSVVVQIKREEKDGYNALQIGYHKIDKKRVSQPLQGHFKRAGVEPRRHLFEVRLDEVDKYTVGDEINVGIFQEKERIDISGNSRGLGFQGVMKRWNFAGGPASHGAHFHRKPGAVGMCVLPGRVIKGKKMPGHAGAKRVTMKRLQVIKVDKERNLIVVKGSTPGTLNSLLQLRKSHD